MFSTRHTNNGDQAYKFVVQAAWEGVLRATVFFWTHCQQVVGVSNPWPYKTPSKPGEPPRKRTGFGQASIVYDTDEQALKTRVGVLKNADYMVMLEIFRNRPWLMATLRKLWPQLAAMVKPVSGKQGKTEIDVQGGP